MSIVLDVVCKKGVGYVRVGERRTTLLGSLTVTGFSGSIPRGGETVSVAFNNSRLDRMPGTGFTMDAEDAISLAVVLIQAAVDSSDKTSDIEVLTRVGAALRG